MSTLTVGDAEEYKTLASAIAAANDGDVLEVQAGTYINDFAEITHKITIEGVGGMVHLVASGQIPNGKAILITDTDVTLDHIEFSGATVHDGNGAGIRYQGGNLTITNSYFHDNQNGILAASDPNGTITIENSEFSHNGSGTGATHNIYVDAILQLTIDNSYIHDAVVGHEVKSRAENTTITNSRIIDGPNGTASYSIDLPNGGDGVIQDNIIEQGPNTQNPGTIAFGEEGDIYGTGSTLTVTGNTILNDRVQSSVSAVWNTTDAAAVVDGNSTYGLSAEQILVGPGTVTNNTFLTAEPGYSTASPIAATNSALPRLSIAADQASKLEGDSGTTPFTFTVTRSGDSSAAVSADFRVSGSVDSADFGGTLPSGTVSFAAGETSKTITINVAGDTTVEPDETLAVTLFNLNGATVSQASASSTVANDDTNLPITIGGQQYTTLASAIAAANDGDVLEVQAGTYINDFAEITHKITIEGVGGMVHLVASGQIPNGKAILITDTDVTLDHIEFSGATVHDGNGAGIRYQGGNLTITNSYFHDNQNGILAASDPNGTITIENSEFSHNGSGTGATHNIYVDAILQLTIDNSYIHDAVVGHEVKSRAENTTITNSRIIDGPNGTASYSIDLPNGGDGVIQDNIIEQGPNTQNPGTIAFGEEGDIYGTGSTLTVTGNTILNDRVQSSVSAVWNTTDAAAVVDGNSTCGLSAEQILVGPGTVTNNTFLTAEPGYSTASPIAATNSALPRLSIAADQASKLEGDSGTTPFTFTVTRSGDSSAAVSADFRVSGSVDSADFGGTLPSGTVSFAAGETSKQVTINVAGDTTVEPDETFAVTLSNPSGATITQATASSTILNDDTALDDDTTLAISADQASKAEGNSGSTPFTFTVTRSGSSTAAVSASYAVTGGTADASDFSGGVLPSGTVSFAAGETSKQVTINVAGDTTVEPDETFAVTLSNPSGATITQATASSTILNDDTALDDDTTLAISADQASKAEGNSGSTPFTFTVTRSGSSTAAVSASYAVTGGTADASDFSGGVLPSGTVSFAAGETSKQVTINVAGDTTVEPDETFAVTLSNPSGATITQATASSTILNDDTKITLETVGAAGPYNRSAPNAWHDAWTNPEVSITTRMNTANSSESWAPLNFGTASPGTYGGSDFNQGALGVAGRTTGTQPVPQDIDGTEGVRFVFAHEVSTLDFLFAGFDPGDRARVDLYNSGGLLISSSSFAASEALIQSMPGTASALVRTDQGAFSLSNLSFG